MRDYPELDYEKEEAESLCAERWQMNLLKLNPSYVSWGNFEDYMSRSGGGWDARAEYDSIDDGLWDLNDLNECVNFYFEVYRPQKPCEICGETGLNPATRKLHDDWYDFAGTGRRWCDKLTQHEVDVLWAHGRLKSEFQEKPTAEQVNAKKGNSGHDTINHYICVQARAEREGVYGSCDSCHGRGYEFTEPNARVGLQLWMLHPRKGCSRGVWINEIKRDDLPAIKSWLQEAARRNADRFRMIDFI